MAQSFLDKLIILAGGKASSGSSTVGTGQRGRLTVDLPRMPTMSTDVKLPPWLANPAMSSSGGAPNFAPINGIPQPNPQEMIERARRDRANKAAVPEFLKVEAAQNAIDVAQAEADKTKKKDRKSDFYTALMAGGFGLTGSEKRGLGAISDAGLIGMQQYTNSAKTRTAATLAAREQLRKESSTQSQNMLNTALAAQAIKKATGKNYAKTDMLDDGRLMIVYEDGTTYQLQDPLTRGPARGNPKVLESVIAALARDPLIEAKDIMPRVESIMAGIFERANKGGDPAEALIAANQ